MARLTGIVVVCLSLWSSTAPTLIYPVYVAHWGLSTLSTQVVFAVYPAALLISLVALGRLSETVGLRLAILAGLGLIGVGAAGFLVADELPLLLAGRALMGVGVGACLGPATAVIANTSADRPGGMRTGTIVTLSSAVGLTAALLVGGFAVAYSSAPLRLSFAVLLLIVCLVVVLTVGLPNDKPAQRPTWQLQALHWPRGRRPFLSGSFAMAAAYSLGSVVMGIGPQFMRDVVGTENALVVGAVLAISSLTIGIAAVTLARTPSQVALWVGFACMLSGQALMIGAGAGASLLWMLFSSIIGGIGYCLVFAAGINLVMDATSDEHRAATATSAYFITYIAQIGVALATGAVATSNGLMAGLIVGSAAVVLLAGLSAVLRPRNVKGLLA